MSLPLPERGQPLDVNHISLMTQAINQIEKNTSQSTYKYVTIDNGTKQSLKASETRIIGGYVGVANNAKKNAGDEVAFSYDFSGDFKYAPIATATPINIGNTEAGRNVSVILKTVSTTKIEGTVKFNSGGDVSVGVNLIVIGIPN
jgi:hypothetical protein